MNSKKLLCRYELSQMKPERKVFWFDFRKIYQNSRNSGKLVPQVFAFSEIGIFKVIF